MKLSFVVPCYGSEKTIENVICEIETVLSQRNEIEYEIITVNDGSPDNELGVLRKLSVEHNELVIADLSKNMGKHSAVMAGFSLVTGDIVVCLDDDGQCPMNELWKLIDALDNNYDISMAKYYEKKQSLFKNFGSMINSTMTKIMLGKPRDLIFSNFFVIRRYIVDEMIRYKNAYPYLEGLILRTTRRIICVEMEERQRFAGDGHFTLGKSLALWVNGFTAFSVKPLRISTIMGCITALAGIIFGIYVVIRKLVIPEVAVGYSSIMAAVMFIGGTIMMMLGMIGEYIGRIYICMNNSPQYVIREIIRNTENKMAENKMESHI